MAVLVIVKGPAKDQKFSLEGQNLAMVGRDAKCSFQILDPTLSRFHMQIRCSPGRDSAIDFNSKNGVEINGRKIESETQLQEGDSISIGETTMIYSLDNSMDAKRAWETNKQFGQGYVPTIIDKS